MHLQRPPCCGQFVDNTCQLVNSVGPSSKVWLVFRHHTTPPQPFYGPFPGPPGWAGARRELLDFMVQGKINRGRHIDHLARRHSIWTNQCPPPPSPHIFLQAGCPSCRPTNSIEALKAIVFRQFCINVQLLNFDQPVTMVNLAWMNRLDLRHFNEPGFAWKRAEEMWVEYGGQGEGVVWIGKMREVKV